MDSSSLTSITDEHGDNVISTGLVDDKVVAEPSPFWMPSGPFSQPHDPNLDASISSEHEPKSARLKSQHARSADNGNVGQHDGVLSKIENAAHKLQLPKSNWASSEESSLFQQARAPNSSHITASSMNNGMQAPVASLASLGAVPLDFVRTSCKDKKAIFLDSKNTSSELYRTSENPSATFEDNLSDTNLLREDVPPIFSDMPSGISTARGNKSSTTSRDESLIRTSNEYASSELQEKSEVTKEEDDEEEDEDENDSDSHASSELRHDNELREELPKKWILTLSMHFRDGTKREKFFITYIRKPNDWVRISVSVDYNHGFVEVTELEEKSGHQLADSHKAPKTSTQMRGGSGSLEADLETIQYQRDKNFVIYKAVYQSLEEIMFFPTITNLQIETLDDRLHIRVAEDINEKIPYPLLSCLDHLNFARYQYVQVPENQVYFESHLSGFVYKVKVHDRICVKKEITSIDTVQEFLYEVEALAKLRKSKYVINLFGVVVGEHNDQKVVTGVLLEYASGGALNDFFYENEHKSLLHANIRMTWIRQVVQGMSDIHEGGYVQGDCTLSNVVIDSDENAKIVDINRRGCPIGWEPPEFRGMIRSGQRISMFIGVKSDLFQLGMVIWAIWNQVEEPDRSELPLRLREDDPDIPWELKRVVEICLKDDPAERLPAKELLTILKPFHEYARPSFRVQDITEGVTREDIQASQRRTKVYHRRGSRDMSEDGAVAAFFTQDDLNDMLQQTQLLGIMGSDTNVMEAELGLGAFADDIKEPALVHFDSGLPDEDYVSKPQDRHIMPQARYEPKRRFAHQDSGFPQDENQSVTMDDIEDGNPSEAEAEDDP